MDEERSADELPSVALEEPEPPPWYQRNPWKPIGLALAVLLLWLVIGLACPPALWRF